MPRPLLAANAIAVLLLAGCGGDYSAPQTFTVSDTAVAGVVEQAVNNSADSPGLSGSPQVTCSSDRSSCNVTYTVKEPAGVSNDIELIEPTRQIWKALFEDQSFQSGTIKVRGPTTSVGGQNATDDLFTLSCDRSAASQIDWSNVDGKGLRTLCNYTALVKGL